MIYENRKYTVAFIFLLVGLIFLSRLFYVQIINDKYKLAAGNNVIRRVTVYPARGLIYSRDKKLLVYNKAAYDLMVIPRQVKNIDTSLFCNLFSITKKDFVKKMKDARHYSLYKESQFIKEISAKEYAQIEDRLYLFNGFYTQMRSLRKYPSEIAAHVLGYIGEVNEADMKKDPYYDLGDYIGKNGIELSYEKYLRGKKGVKRLLVDVHNRIKGSYMNGKYDTAAVAGQNLITTIDAKLQAYGERLMQNKRGSIVAIQPETGEVLCLISAPSYDPNLLVGRTRTKNYLKLLKNKNKPLFNRALMAKYPPGSTFKTVQALIGLQEQVLFPNTHYYCPGAFIVGGLRVGCDAAHGSLNLYQGIAHSCNTYFCNVFRSIIDKYSNAETGFNIWRQHINTFSLGKLTGIDLPNELPGFIPTASYYDKYYGRHHWSALTIISLAIGQGEIGITPLQLANMCTTIANRGYYITPHVVKYIGNTPIQKLDKNIRKHYTDVDKKYFGTVVEGMRDVVTEGTGRYSQIDSLTMCGKTGTAQNPHGKDHSLFIAFAPENNPKIAIEVTVENAGFGATWAAPIASLMIEKYLRDTISRPWIEKRILDADLIHDKK